MRIKGIKGVVKERYAKFAEAGDHREGCRLSEKELSSGYAVDQGLYRQEELSSVPDVALNLSRGCGNPGGFANLKPGEVEVDFGWGGRNRRYFG